MAGMTDQPRWPKGTPGGGHTPGPGPGRFRDMDPTQARREVTLSVFQGYRARAISAGTRVLMGPQDTEYTGDHGLVWQSETGYRAVTPKARSQGGLRGEDFGSEDQALAYLIAHAQSPRGPRERYNSEMLTEALSYERANEEGDSDLDEDEDDREDLVDEHLSAQIDLVEKMRDEGTPEQWDAAVDHLRGMLLISYADDEDLPNLPT